MARTFRVGTRGSPLALRQTQEVIGRLQARFPAAAFVPREVTTRGDVVLDRPLREFGGRGVFVKEVEVLLQEGDVDLAVHSLKDMPVTLPPGLVIAAVCDRRDARDALVVGEGLRDRCAGLADLPPGARIGTGSLRRAAQLRAFRPDLRVAPVRGNLQTRLRKLAEGQFDALVLAAAGLERLGLTELIAERIPFSVSLPAPGQGALAVEVRADDDDVREMVAAIDEPQVRAEVTAERALLAALGGGCHIPVGAWAYVEEGVLRLEAMVASGDGTTIVRDSVSGSPDRPEELGRKLAARLVERGAGSLLAGLSDGDAQGQGRGQGEGG